MDKFTKNSYPGVLCALAILLLTGLPGSCLPHAKPLIGFDKVVHLLMFAGFAFVTLWGYRKPYAERGEGYRRKALLITIVIGLIYGVLTEIMQEAFIPGRNGSLYDWIADAIGTILGAIIAHFLLRDRNNLKNDSLVNK